MQLTPRYLVNNRITVVVDEAGFTTEYRPVYQRTLKVYKGIDNVLQFQLKNADQKSIDVTNYTTRFVAFDSEHRKVLDITGELIPGNDSSLIQGLFQVRITEGSLLDFKQQYLTYSIYLIDAQDTRVLTYADEQFDAAGIIYVSAAAFPGVVESTVTSLFSLVGYNSIIPSEPFWVTELIDAKPELNNNTALHTAAIYTDGYVGSVVIEGTLANQVTNQTQWAPLDTLVFNNEIEPLYSNFNGMYTFVRFRASVDPIDLITKILIRN